MFYFVSRTYESENTIGEAFYRSVREIQSCVVVQTKRASLGKGHTSNTKQLATNAALRTGETTRTNSDTAGGVVKTTTGKRHVTRKRPTRLASKIIC